MDAQQPDSDIKFKPSRKRNLRQRLASADSDHNDTAGDPAQCGTKDDDETPTESIRLAEARVRQKLRQKPNGVNIIGLALGKRVTVEEQITTKDPFNQKSGGMVNMQALKAGKVNAKPSEDAYDVGIGTQFSAETNKRDEDEEMMKYIEDQLVKRKLGAVDGGAGDADDEADALKYMSPEEAALMALPDHLRVGSAHRSEEMLSNQMLNGIPEVDLGIEAKIRNIEATEAAKEKLLQDQKNKADGPSHFVPTNMAVNFVQHNRFNLDPHKRRGHAHNQHSQPYGHQQPNGGAGGPSAARPATHSVGGGGRPPGDSGQRPNGGATRGGHAGKPGGVKKATDDYHYDKFKKQFRRY